MSIKINGETFTTFDDFYNNPDKVSPTEKQKIDFEVDLIGKIIKAREQKGLSQRELAALSGVKQPQIARIEMLKSTPQLDTLLKLLTPLGYKLSIVPV